MAGTGFAQIYYLNMAMARFDNQRVIPTFYVTFTAFAVVSGAVLLKKNLANKIFGYLARCEFWAKIGLRFLILVG